MVKRHSYPDTWSIGTLEDICVPNGVVRGPFGGALKKEIFVPFGYKVYEQRNAIYQSVNIGSYYVNESKYREMSRFAVKSGDYIISCSGTIGRIYQIPLTFPKGIINQALLKLTINTEKINPTYFYKYFQWDKFQQKIIDDTQGGAMKNLVGMDIFKKAPIVLPEMKEQTAIAEALSDIDGLISSLQKLIEKKKAIKQGAMQELLTGKKRLPGFSGKWTNTTLGRCFSKIVGGGTPSRAISEFWNGEIPWATVKDFATFNPYKTQEYISEAGLNHSSTHLIPKGTLITSTRMGIGKIVIYYVDVAINQDLKALFVSDDVSKEYIYHLFGMVGKIIESLGNGSTVKGIRIEQLKNLSIVLPKKNEQQAIAQVLSDMDSEIEQLEKKLAKYQQIKQGMMQELLTGRIRVV